MASAEESAAKVDLKFEVVVIPVADVDRAKAFYAKLGWRLDADFVFDNGIPGGVVHSRQGQGALGAVGAKITTAAPGLGARALFSCGGY